jgi:hypothetical protein
MVSIFLADILYLIHIVVTIIIFFGNFFLPIKYLPHLSVLIIVIMLNWSIDDTCILTKMENYFRTGHWVSISAREENAPEFFRPLIYKITGIQMSRQKASNLNQFLFLTILLITLLRIFYRMKI